METKVLNITKWLGAGSINLFGRPFAGKDTQGQILAETVGGALVGGGDILRSHHDPAAIEQIMAAGGIIPSEYYLNMILPYLSRPEFSGKPLILSAVGRAHGEENAVLQAAEASGHPLMAVIVLNLPETEVWRRFEQAQQSHDRGSRSDDSREVLQNRLQKFNDKTLPVIDFYREKGLLIEVDGTGTKEAVSQGIFDSLMRVAAAAAQGPK